MGSTFRTAVSLVVWAVALYGVLQIGLRSDHGAHGHDGLSICGPWGCGPPVQALVGWHGFWLVLAAMPVGLVILCWPVKRVNVVGIGLAAVGFLTLAGIGIYEAVTWLPNISEGEPPSFIQRCLFSLVTLTDVPVIPVTLSGIVMVLGAVLKNNRVKHQEVDHVRADAETDLPLAEGGITPIAEPSRSSQ